MSFFNFNLALALVDDAIQLSTADAETSRIIPAYVALQTFGNHVLSVGEEARTMAGQTPPNITVVKVLREGELVEWEEAEAFLRHGLVLLHGKSIFRPRPAVVAAVRTSGSAASRRVFLQLAIRAGAREVHLIDIGMATAIGMGLPVQEPQLQAVLTVSNDWFEFTAVALSGIVVSAGGAIGSETFLEDIRNHVVLTRELRAEPAGLRALLWSRGIDATAVLQTPGWETWSGRSELGRLVTGEVSGADLSVGLMPSLVRMTERIKEALRRLTSEQQAQLARSTIHANGSALEIPGLAAALGRLLGMSVTPFQGAPHPALGGARRALAEIKFLRKVAVSLAKSADPGVG